MEARVYEIIKVQVDWLVKTTDRSRWPPTIIISALAMSNTSGWSQPKLVPWMRIVRPDDGFLDLDFIATAPAGIVEPTISPVYPAVIALPLPHWVTLWITGVRVHGATNSAEAGLPGGKISGMAIEPESLPLPWPFPWILPPKEK
jgi:hypothetical protein